MYTYERCAVFASYDPLIAIVVVPQYIDIICEETLRKILHTGTHGGVDFIRKDFYTLYPSDCHRHGDHAIADIIFIIGCEIVRGHNVITAIDGKEKFARIQLRIEQNEKTSIRYRSYFKGVP